MNIETMTDEQVADALAEACGWLNCGELGWWHDAVDARHVEHPFRVGDLTAIAESLPIGWVWWQIERAASGVWEATAAGKGDGEMMTGDGPTEWRARAVAALLAYRAEKERAGGGA